MKILFAEWILGKRRMVLDSLHSDNRALCEIKCAIPEIGPLPGPSG